jgi:hypothetical protein
MKIEFNKFINETLEEVHNCKESKGKIVCISIDLFGNSFCGYCGKQVNYKISPSLILLDEYDKIEEENFHKAMRGF